MHKSHYLEMRLYGVDTAIEGGIMPKTCTKCNIEFKRIQDNFYMSRGKPQQPCKRCRSGLNARYHRYSKGADGARTHLTMKESRELTKQNARLEKTNEKLEQQWLQRGIFLERLRKLSEIWRNQLPKLYYQDVAQTIQEYTKQAAQGLLKRPNKAEKGGRLTLPSPAGRTADPG